MKQKIVLTTLFLAAFFIIVNNVESSTSQPPSGYSGNPTGNATCNSCHSGSTIVDATQFTIRMAKLQADLPNASSIVTSSTTFQPDSNYFISLTLNGSASGNKYGFQFYPSNASGILQGTPSLITPTTTTSLSSGYVGHLNANSTKSWTFRWKAPNSTNAVTFYYVGLYANNLGGNTGDVVYKSSVTLQGSAPCVPPTTPVISGSSVFCSGGNNSISVPAQAGVTFAWSNGGSGTTVNPATPATYTVTASNACGTVTSTPFTVNQGVNVTTPTITGDSIICPSQTKQLTVGTAPMGHTYTWSTGGSGTTISVTTGGTYSVTATTNCGTASASFTINQRSAPTTPTITGDTTVCPGNATTLSITSVSGHSYSWSNGASGASAPVAAGSYTVTATNVCGTVASAPFTVSQSNSTSTPLIVGDTAVCAGASVLLSVSNLSSGTTYAWSSGSTSDTARVGAGSYTVTATSSCGTAASSAFVVSQKQSPTMPMIGGNTSFCQGDSTMLSVSNPVAGNSYTWSNGVTGNSIMVKTAGSYTISASTSCGTMSSMVSVTQNPTPTVTVSQTGFVLKASSPSFISYKWFRNGNQINGAIDSTYTATQNGSYNVEVEDANGCIGISNSVNVTGVSISEQIVNRFSIYPNPANDFLNIGFEEKTNATIEIIDALGRIHLKSELKENESTINVSQLPSGVYILNLQQNGISQKKLFTKN